MLFRLGYITYWWTGIWKGISKLEAVHLSSVDPIQALFASFLFLTQCCQVAILHNNNTTPPERNPDINYSLLYKDKVTLCSASC